MAIKAEPYSKQMQKLNDVQLKFEFLKKESINTDLFRDAPNLSDLNSLLASIEGYLHDIISEYEQSYDKFSDDNLCPVEMLLCFRNLSIVLQNMNKSQYLIILKINSKNQQTKLWKIC